MPPAHSRAGSVSSSSGSQSTAAGCQNAPTSFLAATLIAVLPPIAASTWPTSVDGTASHGTPRRNVAAANPPTSVTEPPPAHTITSLRSSSHAASARHTRSSAGQRLRRLAALDCDLGARCAEVPSASSTMATAPCARARAAPGRRASRPAGRARRPCRRPGRPPRRSRPRPPCTAAARLAPSCSNACRSPASGRAPGATSTRCHAVANGTSSHAQNARSRTSGARGVG